MPKSLDLPPWLWHCIGYEKRYISEIIGLEIVSQAETASVARRAANRKDFYIKSVWSQ